MDSFCIRVAVFSFLGLCAPAFAQTTVHPDERIKTVDWEKTFRHEHTGIIMASEIEGFRVDELSDYQELDGVKGHFSLRYVKSPINIDVYFSRPDGESGDTDADPLALHKSCLGAVIGGVQIAAERGYYEDVSIPDQASVSSFGGDQNLAMVSTVFTLRDHRDRDLPTDDRPLKESGIAIAIHGDWQLKTRWTFPLDEDEKIHEERRGAVQKFLESYRSLIAEAGIRPEVLKMAESLRADPTSKDAMGTVIGFAEASQLVRITIDPKHLPIEDLEDGAQDDPSLSSCLLASFVAGNMLEQYRKLEFESQDLAGAEFMVDAYEVLRRDGKYPPVAKLDAWVEAKKAGKLEEAIEKGD